MKVIVCGGRAYNNARKVFEALDAIDKRDGITRVIQGGANGADALAREWAVERGKPVTTVPASWGMYGKMAGPIRNLKMIPEHKPDLVIAFPGGRGTEDMVGKAMNAGVPVEEIR